jgi:hypothetical protein
MTEGLVLRNGEGRRTSPYRYWLVGQEKRWLAENPAYIFELQREQDEKCIEAMRKRQFGL